MFDLNTYFDGMSKQLLREVHGRAFGHKGLLNNALIQSDVFSFYTNKNRARELFQKMEPWQQHCIYLAYHSGSRGLNFNELRLAVPVSKHRELRNFLIECCKNYLLWRGNSAAGSIHYGFSDFNGLFELPKTTDVRTEQNFTGFLNQIDWHVCLVLSFAMRKELKVNSNNTLHRRSFQICTDCFASSKHVSGHAAECELNFIFNFLTANNWLELEDSHLVPSDKALDFIRKNGFRLHQDIISWWLKERFKGDRAHCVRMLQELAHPTAISDACLMWWALDPSSRMQDKGDGMPFEQLPRPLRELWLLGLANFQMSRSKVIAVALSDSGRDWINNAIASIPEQNISCLPNFELIVSTGTSPRVLFTLACLSKVENDELFLRFNLNKEAYVQGLKCGLPESEIEHFRTWIKPPENVASTIDEWNASFYGAKVQTVRLLKILDLKVLGELAHFPEFLEQTEEYIPGYGFILNPQKETQAFEILENYGYVPFVERASNNRANAPTEEWRKEFAVPWYEAKSIDYDLKDNANDTSLQNALDSTKYGSNYQKLNVYDLVNVLRYAKTVGSVLGAKTKEQSKTGVKESEIFFYVHALKLAKTPQIIEIQIKGEQELTTLNLNSIQEIKVVSNQAPA
ncbi:MAG: hypothetical protein HUK20_11590 [Fibrobacter sp.]|nr:hypothetical protein [Fibrobacter sp.]